MYMTRNMWQSARSKLSIVKFVFVLWISKDLDDTVENCELVHFSMLVLVFGCFF
jgi:hypothetical protein